MRIIKTGIVHAVGWLLLVVGIVLWTFGIWLGPTIFIVGMVVETIGYVFLRNWGSKGEVQKSSP